MAIDWSEMVAMIQQHDRWLLMTHIRPDADGLGSQLALAEALTTLGKTPRVVIASPLLPRYRFLDPNQETIEQFDANDPAFRDVDAILVMDTGTWNQLGTFGPFMQSMDVPKAVIDHHRTQDDLGGIRCVDIQAEATGRLAYELISTLKVPISATMAQRMFMALALDTGWFRHANTTPDTFALAGELTQLGAEPTKLYEQLFESSNLARLRLIGIALERLQTHADGQIATTEIMLADYEKTGAVPGDTEELINHPRSILGVEIAMIFIEQPEGGTKVSFRSKSADVSKLAELFNGGGHKLAAGARTELPLTETKRLVLDAARKNLSQS